jgi:hypothetical protein
MSTLRRTWRFFAARCWSSTTGSLLGSVDAVRTWQQRIAGSELAVVDSDSYHVAAAKPDDCAQKVLAFVRKHSDS